MKFKAWIQAFRLRTLPLAFSSIFLGSFLAADQDAFQYGILIWSLVTTLFLQVLSNLANDYGDATSGVDGAQRTGPKRTVSAGLISRSAMKRALVVCSILAFASGVYLTFLAFGDQWAQVSVFVVLGMAAVAAAIKYTVGKNPYGYAGFGDFFVLLFFGFVGVGGSYYLYTHALDWAILLPSASCGLLSVGVLNVNNIRDIASDKAAGKYSIPVRIGRSAAIWYQWMLLLFAVVFMLVFTVLENKGWESYVFLLSLPLLGRNAWAVKTKTTSSELDPYLKQLALSTLVFVLLVGVGLYLG